MRTPHVFSIAAIALVAACDTSVNGQLTLVDITSAIVGTTGNGDIELRQSSTRDADATLTTGNGSITATLPSTFRGRVEATTGNGVVRSDFPVIGSGTLDGRHLSGTIGAGGA